MSSLRNVLPRRIHQERSQPESRKKFGLLEKHKDYAVRARAYQKKKETIQILREKAAFRNPDEFNFGMVKSRTVNGVHRSLGEANKYTHDELMLMKTQDIGYVHQTLQSEKKKVERLTSVLHSVDNQPSNKHIYFAEDRLRDSEYPGHIHFSSSNSGYSFVCSMCRKLAGSYRELEARKNRVSQLEKPYMEMTLQKELQKKGRKRKLRPDETSDGAVSAPVYKWRRERKR
ncbi:Probable U3 small nucleolar RNA-associated protein 11 [Linum perenne]